MLKRMRCAVWGTVALRWSPGPHQLMTWSVSASLSHLVPGDGDLTGLSPGFSETMIPPMASIMVVMIPGDVPRPESRG